MKTQMLRKHFVLLLMFLLAIGMVYGADESAVNSHSFYGSVTAGGVSAVSGATVCVSGAGDDCISVSPVGLYGAAEANADKLVAVCTTGDTISFTIAGSGCTGTSTLTTTCDPISITDLTLAFSGTCGTAAASTSGGGGGGGGGSGGGFTGSSIASTTDISGEAGFSSGDAVTAALSQGDVATITIGDTTYEITLSTLTDDFVVIEYDEDFITLQPGEATRIDLNGDGKADVSVQLNSIVGGEATLKFVKLQDISPRAGDDTGTGAADGSQDSAKASGDRAPLKGVIVVIAIVLLGLVGYFNYLRRPR